MKFAIAVLALAGFVLAHISAAPAEVAEKVDDSLVSTDTTSALAEANEANEEMSRTKKSTGPKTLCFQTQDVQGRSILQCADSADSEAEGTSLYSSYSAPAPSYGGSSSYGSSSGGYSAPSYKVSFLI